MLTRLLAVAALALPIPALAQSLTPDETTRIDTLVTGALADTGVPSASIAVVRGGRIVFTRAYGKPSETIRTADPALPYQIASISKQFTAAATVSSSLSLLSSSSSRIAAAVNCFEIEAI